jgi:hypothetical protein
MGFANGKVTIDDEPTKSKLYRYCEKKIDQWIKTQIALEDVAAGVAADDPEAEFIVEFAHEDGAKQISCMTEIHVRGALWRGYDLATDSQQAFMHSLKRLQPH